MANRCFLYFQDAADDQLSVDSDRVNAIRSESDTSTVIVDFADAAGGFKKVTLSTTVADQANVVKELSRLVLQGVGVITIADDVNSVYGVKGIDGIDAITHS